MVVSTNMLKILTVFLEKYRDNRFEKPMETVKQLAINKKLYKIKTDKKISKNSLSQLKLALIAVENEIGDSLSLENILDTFAAKKARKYFF